MCARARWSSILPVPFVAAALLLTPARALPAAVVPGAPATYAAAVDTALARVRAGRGSEALVPLRRALAISPDDAAMWLLRGDLAADARGTAEAVDSYRHALQLGARTPAVVAEDLARAFAGGGERDSALTWLEQSIAWGNEHRPELGSDSAFVSLFGEARFRAATGQLPAREFTRDEGWRYDLDYLVSEVKRMHYRYRVQALPPEFENDHLALERRIPELSDGQVLLALQRLLVRLGDGHSTLYPVSERTGPWPVVPLRTYLFRDGAWVVEADSAHASAIGKRVLSINGVPIDRVLADLPAVIPHDNAMGVRWMAPLFLTMPDLVAVSGDGSVASSITFELAERAGKPSRMTVTPGMSPGNAHVHIPRLTPSRLAGAGPVPRWMAHMDDPYWFGPLEDSSIVYLQFNEVANDRRERLRDFAARLTTYLDGHDVRDLVVDVRHNNGGNGNLNVSLERALVRFEGGLPGRKLWVITGRGTFSAAQSFINDIERLTSATFAGEPSSSRPNFIGESTSLLLPWSGAIGSISTRLHSSRDADERTWIAPRLPVELSSFDYFANRDPVLEAVVAAAKARRPAP
ncbi:MAG: hypothetical protein ABI960_06050 [Candidatus Eisenbacteria bacterium]